MHAIRKFATYTYIFYLKKKLHRFQYRVHGRTFEHRHLRIGSSPRLNRMQMRLRYLRRYGKRVSLEYGFPVSISLSVVPVQLSLGAKRNWYASIIVQYTSTYIESSASWYVMHSHHDGNVWKHGPWAVILEYRSVISAVRNINRRDVEPGFPCMYVRVRTSVRNPRYARYVVNQPRFVPTDSEGDRKYKREDIIYLD